MEHVHEAANEYDMSVLIYSLASIPSTTMIVSLQETSENAF